MKTMYYDNILVSDLMNDEHLEHHGVLGMKWGIRRYQSYSQVPRKSGEGGKEQGLAKKKSKLESKRASNNAKISQYKRELSKPRTAKDVAKAKKYQAKLDKVNSSRITKSAMKYRTRGEDVGLLGEIQMRKKAKYEHKIAKLNMKSDKLNAKISNLEYKNLKIDKKLKNIDTKQEIARLKKIRDYNIADASEIVMRTDPYSGKSYIGKDKKRIHAAKAEYKRNVAKAKKDPNSTKPNYEQDLKELEAWERAEREEYKKGRRLYDYY